MEEEIGGDGERTRVVKQGRTTLLEDEGGLAVVVLLIPVVIALLPVALGRRRVARVAVASAAALLVAFVILTGFSIGLLYVPAALAMVAALFAPHPSRRLARGVT